MLAFGGSRTFHRLVCAVEDAGWEVRDVLMYFYGSGFPKSMDVSKAIDKTRRRDYVLAAIHGGGQSVGTPDATTAPATESARMWDGYGTALKPAYEPVVLARKPLDGTVAANVQQWGCGALWIDGGRIEGVVPQVTQGGQRSSGGIMNATGGERGTVSQPHELGRWPANVLLSIPDDEYALRGDVTEEQLRSLMRWLDENPEL